MALHGLESRPEALDSQPRGSGLEERLRVLRTAQGLEGQLGGMEGLSGSLECQSGVLGK